MLLPTRNVAQSRIYLTIQEENDTESTGQISTKLKDSILCMDYLQKYRSKKIKKGYIMYSFDTIVRDGSNWTAHAFTGPQLDHLQIKADPEIIRELRKNSVLREKMLLEVPLSGKEIDKLMKSILNSYSNNGHPFAKVNLSEIEFNADNLSARLEVSKGPYYTVHSIIVRGDSTIHTKNIQNLIDIKAGDPHDEEKIRNIDQRIKQLNYLKTAKATELLFKPEGTDIYMYLEKIPVSSINGIIGFQPNSTTGKLDLTGEANLKLTNALNRGEKIQFQWQSIRDQTQNLQSYLSYPYLFNSKFGIEGKFDLYKRDSTFLELKYRTAVNYYLSNSTYISGFYQGYRSNALSGAANSQLFSRIGNSSVNLYGLGFTSYQYDYLQNPRKGYSIKIESGIGNRIFSEPDTSIRYKTLSYRGSIELELFIPLYKKHVLKLASQSEFVGSDEGVFENELFRFGGQQSQRGFNEDELYASTRTTQTIEYRYLLDKNAFVFLFFDQSWYENNSTKYVTDHPFGFGTGISFSTGLGIFSLSYALGKQFDNPIRLADGKIHFGYIAYF